jgi:hypothetical protein
MSWVEPQPALPFGEAQVLTDSQVKSWRENGFALVTGVLPEELLRTARAQVAAVLPAPGSPEAEAMTDFGSNGLTNFPYNNGSAANDVTLHPRLLAAVRQLLATDDIRLTQAELWPKYGRRQFAGESDNTDQRIHCDYPNHTLTLPPPWEAPEAVEMILYLDDVAVSGGATAVVPRTGADDPAYVFPIVGMPGVGVLEWKNDRETAEEYLMRVAPEVAEFRRHIYAREQRVRYSFGTILFYRHDTWHRGTPLNPGALRIVQNLTFRKGASEWISTLHTGWTWAMYSQTKRFEDFLCTASVEQRSALGFPRPGHAFWSKQTVFGVAARYGGKMVMEPYAAGL